MRKGTLLILTSILLSSVLAAPALAGIVHAQSKHPSLPHYVIKDVGSLGGGFGLYSNPGSRVLNRHGTGAGFASTGIPDPFCPDWCFGPDGYTEHAFIWKRGTTDLGALADGVTSAALGLS